MNVLQGGNVGLQLQHNAVQTLYKLEGGHPWYGGQTLIDDGSIL